MMIRLQKRIEDEERGWALVIAVVVMSLMLGLGLVALSIADTQTQKSRQERERETSLNLAEGVLYSQSFILSLPASTTGASEGWPSTAARAYTPCTEATGGLQCPNDATLANVANTTSAPANFAGVDTARGAAWTSELQDNGGRDGAAGAPAISTDYADASKTVHWDANGDKKIWVRTSATVRGRVRVIVGLMGLEQIPLNFPKNVLTAGSFDIQQSGNQPYIDTGGTSIQIRCPTAPSTSCADYSRESQISPGGTSSISTGYSSPTVLSADVKKAIKTTAQTNGTYYPSGTCPTGPQLTGEVVYVENCTHSYNAADLTQNCTFDGVAYLNCANGIRAGNPGAAAGLLVWNKGVFELGGNTTFVGVIYHLNADNCGTESPDIPDGPTCPAPLDGQSIIVSIQGGATVVGAVSIDGAGGIAIGSNSLNLVYNPNVFNTLSTAGTTGLVQNSWRELPKP